MHTGRVTSIRPPVGVVPLPAGALAIAPHGLAPHAKQRVRGRDLGTLPLRHGDAHLAHIHPFPRPELSAGREFVKTGCSEASSRLRQARRYLSGGWANGDW